MGIANISRKAAFYRQKLGLLTLALCSAALMMSAAWPASAERPLIIAHRGASGHAPENTMAAFEQAERLGADFIELDVRMSKDGELVVIHDKTVDRITGETGFVHDYTLEQLRSMDAGSYYGKAFANERLLSLEAVLSRFYGGIGLLIELKEPQLYPGIEEKLAEAVRRHELLQLTEQLGYGGGVPGGTTLPGGGRLDAESTIRESILNGESIFLRKNLIRREAVFHDGIIIQSFHAASMHRMHALLPDIPIGVLVHADQHPLPGKTLDKLAAFAAYINYSYDQLDEALVGEIHKHGSKVMAYTIRKKQDMLRMKRLGVDGIITNYPGWG